MIEGVYGSMGRFIGLWQITPKWYRFEIYNCQPLSKAHNSETVIYGDVRRSKGGKSENIYF